MLDRRPHSRWAGGPPAYGQRAARARLVWELKRDRGRPVWDRGGEQGVPADQTDRTALGTETIPNYGRGRGCVM